MDIDKLPKYTDFMRPTLQVIESAGGSASLNEINNALSEVMGLSDEALNVEYDSGAGLVIADRMSWARSYLKKAQLLESGGRGIWVLSDDGRSVLDNSSDEELKSLVAEASRNQTVSKKPSVVSSGHSGTDTTQSTPDWKDEMLSVVRNIQPDAFERLCQRLLRESGFVKVEVTGRSGDGGIDGTGILQLSLMSFHVLFQSKRYKGSVGSGAVRDFRGAMMGRTDKGLIITTGTFTHEARKEATRDGAPPIDLIDGDELCEKLKTLGLGVVTRQVEEVTVRQKWFEEL